MRLIRWLLTLAKENPLIFSIALLLIATSIMAKVIVNRDGKIDNCDLEKTILQGYYNAKLDSIDAWYNAKITNLNNKIEDQLNSTIKDYKDQLDQQRNINTKINTTLNKNTRLIKNTKNKIDSLQNEN